MFRRGIALPILTLSMDEVGGRHHAPSTLPRERGPVPSEENVQGGARNVIPFYHPIKTVTS